MRRLENGRFSALADAGEFRNGAITPGGPIKLIVFDADTDGDLDMLTYGGSVGTEFYLNDGGQGSFYAHQLNLAWNPSNGFAAAADIDGDGRDDIVFARGNQLGIWHQSEVQNGDAQAGNGAEAVECTETLIDVVVDDAITALHVDDVDGDGDFDILIGTKVGSA